MPLVYFQHNWTLPLIFSWIVFKISPPLEHLFALGIGCGSESSSKIPLQCPTPLCHFISTSMNAYLKMNIFLCIRAIFVHILSSLFQENDWDPAEVSGSHNISTANNDPVISLRIEYPFLMKSSHILWWFEQGHKVLFTSIQHDTRSLSIYKPIEWPSHYKKTNAAIACNPWHLLKSTTRKIHPDNHPGQQSPPSKARVEGRVLTYNNGCITLLHKQEVVTMTLDSWRDLALWQWVS